MNATVIATRAADKFFLIGDRVVTRHYGELEIIHRTLSNGIFVYVATNWDNCIPRTFTATEIIG